METNILIATTTRQCRLDLRFILLLLLLAPFAANACVPDWFASQSFKVQGQATSHDGEPLYGEFLTKTPNDKGGVLVVDYRDPQGKDIARKTVDYGCFPTSPSYELADLVTDRREGVRWMEDTVESYRGNDVSIIDVPDGQIIVDAGFDTAIQFNWDALTGGESVRFHYLFARDNRFLKLRLKRAKAPKFLRGEVDDSAVFFKIAANNFLFRLLSDPIYVGYDRESRALRYYIGPSNLPTMSDKGNVVIRYGEATPA